MSRLQMVMILIAVLLALVACSKELKTEDAALIAAARTGHPGTVRDMLAAGANVNVKDEHGNTPLIEAARNGHDDVVRTLLDSRADVRAKNDEGQTALMLAVRGGHDETGQLLRQAGAVE
jgi:ankyrin repeat protein